MNTVHWNRLRYTLYAPLYDAVVQPLSTGRQRALRLLAPRSGEKVLLVGVGTGLDLAFLPTDSAITAVDIAPAMVRKTATRAAHLRRSVVLAAMNAQTLAFAPATFDAVVLHLVLAVVPDPVASIREVARVLKPGGRISIFDKFLPDGAVPSPARRMINVATNTIFSDINRQLGPLLAQGAFRLEHEEPAALRGAYRVVRAVKPHATTEPSSKGPS